MITDEEYDQLYIGARVTYVYIHSHEFVPDAPGMVTYITATSLRIHWDGHGFTAEGNYRQNQNVYILCRHCAQKKPDHADNGKCLFSPTSYEI